MQFILLNNNLYLYPIKWVASMPSNAACGTGKVWQEAVLAVIFWSAQDRGRTSDAVRTLVSTSIICLTHPTNHFIQVSLSMKFHPYNMQLLL
jgi:hypothetical protein